MGLQIPRDSKLEEDDQPICINVDLSHHKTDPEHVLLVILRRCSSFLVSTVVFIGLFYNIWSSLLPLQNEHIHRLSIWMSLLGLLGSLVFVCAVVVIILVGGVFTSMQKATLIILHVWMLIQSANSILEVCVILLGGAFMVWFAFWIKESPNDESDIQSSNTEANKLSAQTIK